jgi:hypothetical protein
MCHNVPQCATQTKEEVEKLVKEQEDAQKEAACLLDIHGCSVLNMPY